MNENWIFSIIALNFSSHSAKLEWIHWTNLSYPEISFITHLSFNRTRRYSKTNWVKRCFNIKSSQISVNRSSNHRTRNIISNKKQCIYQSRRVKNKRTYGPHILNPKKRECYNFFKINQYVRSINNRYQVSKILD